MWVLCTAVILTSVRSSAFTCFHHTAGFLKIVFRKLGRHRWKKMCGERDMFFPLSSPPLLTLPLAAAFGYLPKSKPNYISFEPRPPSTGQIVLSTEIPSSTPLLFIWKLCFKFSPDHGGWSR